MEAEDDDWPVGEGVRLATLPGGALMVPDPLRKITVPPCRTATARKFPSDGRNASPPGETAMVTGDAVLRTLLLMSLRGGLPNDGLAIWRTSSPPSALRLFC